MFLTLLAVTLLLAAIVSWLVSRAFSRPVGSILDRIIADSISDAWRRYMKFAILVVGVSSGVRIDELERYINAPQWVEADKARIIALTPSAGCWRSTGRSSKHCRASPGCCWHSS